MLRATPSRWSTSTGSRSSRGWSIPVQPTPSTSAADDLLDASGIKAHLVGLDPNNNEGSFDSASATTFTVEPVTIDQIGAESIVQFQNADGFPLAGPMAAGDKIAVQFGVQSDIRVDSVTVDLSDFGGPVDAEINSSPIVDGDGNATGNVEYSAVYVINESFAGVNVSDAAVRIDLIERAPDNDPVVETSAPVAIDSVGPIATIERGTPEQELTNHDSVDFEVSFSKSVVGFSAQDLVVETDPAASTRIEAFDTADNQTFSVTVSGAGLADYEGLLTLKFAENAVIADLLGNRFVPAQNQVVATYNVDTHAPDATFADNRSATLFDNSVDGNGDPVVNDAVQYTVTFSEDVQALTSDDLTIANGSLDTTGLTETATDSGVYVIPVVENVATFDVRAVQDSVANISVTVKDTVLDVAGNALVEATNTSVTVDTVNPSVVSIEDNQSESATLYDGGDAVAYTVTFSEDVQALTSDDLTIANGSLDTTGLTETADGVRVSTDPGVKVATFKRAADSDSVANISVTVNDTVLDVAGNALVEATNTSVTVDTVNPSVVSIEDNQSESATLYDGGDAVAYTVTFSEDVQALTSADLTIANGSLDTTGLTETATDSGVYVIPVVENVATFNVRAVQDSVANISVTVKDTVLDVAGNALVECDRYLGDC